MATTDRSRLQIAFYIFFLICMAIRYGDGLMLHQLMENPLHDPRRDPVIWLIQWSGLPDLLSVEPVSYIFDLIVITIPLIILIRIYGNKSIQRLVLIHAMCFVIYILSINCYPTLSIRKYLGLALVPFAFAFLRTERLVSYLSLMRYFVCYIFASASLWKISRGAVWQPDQMKRILMDQHIEHIVHFPNHIVTQFVMWMLDHASLMQALLLSGVAAQALFIVGFFTKKYDRVLTILLVIFIAMDYLVMRIEYWEFLVFVPILWYSGRLLTRSEENTTA